MKENKRERVGGRDRQAGAAGRWQAESVAFVQWTAPPGPGKCRSFGTSPTPLCGEFMTRAAEAVFTLLWRLLSS